MTLPQPTRQVAIAEDGENAQTRTIRFFGTEEIAAHIRTNGYGGLTYDETTGQWTLAVSPLYPYQAVLDWLRDLEAA